MSLSPRSGTSRSSSASAEPPPRDHCFEGVPIPYENLSDLPESVRNNLPGHAQEIYRAAFNSAEEQYGEEEPGESSYPDPADRSREVRARSARERATAV